MVRIAKANDSSVGKTADAEKITFDGTDIQLESGKYEYDASKSGPLMCKSRLQIMQISILTVSEEYR